jgi:hypothetical protein
MTSPAVEPVKNEVVVNTGVERAFALFTSNFDAIKPREHTLLTVASPGRVVTGSV